MTEIKARFVTEPTVVLLGEMQLRSTGLREMMRWIGERSPQCLPDRPNTATRGDVDPNLHPIDWPDLFPHDLTQDGRELAHNELLVELAGRKCYNSFGLKAGRKSNREYIEHTQQGEVPHRSIMYHAKLSFFIAGVSRRVSHELIRNYVGADRDEEGSPSQESTRYVENAGFYVVPPRYIEGECRGMFESAMQTNYHRYRTAVRAEIETFEKLNGKSPKGMDYKRILEAGSSLLSHAVETSWIWTTNPVALAKMALERDNEFADLEFQRLMKKWKRVCLEAAPNLFPQPWMRES